MTGEAPDFGHLPLPPDLSPRSGRRGTSFGGPRRRRQHRWLTIVAGTLSFLVLASSAFAYGYYEKLNGNIHRVKVFGYVAEKDRPAKAKDGAENILLVGSDSRVGLTPAELAEASTTGDGGGTNTDTIMLLHISSDNAVTIVGFPRDSFVPIPGHGTFKINSAYADGEAEKKGTGPAKLTQTVENLTGIHIDHYMQVNFVQFIAISNAIGGVNVCISNGGKGAHDDFSGIDLPDGVTKIKGAQALAYVRQRHGLPNGDIDRIGRQQRFITAMIKQVKTIRDPATLNALLTQITSSLTVDSGLTGRSLIDLANRLQGVDLSSIQFLTVPITNQNASTTINGQNVSYVQLNMALLPGFFAPLINDTSATPTTSAPAIPTVPPSTVSVQVLNGRGTSGAATTASTALRQAGFVIAGTGNADRASTTTIRYGSSQAAAAATLAKAIPGATLTADSTLGTTVILTLGTDNLSVTTPGSTTTSPAAPTTTAPPVTAANDDCGV